MEQENTARKMEQHIPQLDIRTTDLIKDLIAALRIQREIVEAQIRNFDRLSKSSGNQQQIRSQRRSPLATANLRMGPHKEK
jgi:hypothetical protein